jgi:SAM-dependent methyltransferase
MPVLKLATRPVECALCGGSESQFLCQNDGLEVVRCTSCGLVFVNPQPTEDAVRQYYSDPDLARQDGWSAYFQHSAQQITQLWQERLGDLRRWRDGVGVRLLDVGSGWGDFLHCAKPLGWKVAGFEFSPSMARFCEERYGITVQIGSLFETSFAGSSFDIVTMWHVLEHLRAPQAVLQRLHNLLVPGGILAVEVPNLNFLPRRSYKYPFSKTLHLYHFSPATLTGILTKVGFKVLWCGRGNTGFLYSSRAKIFAKKCIYALAAIAEGIGTINISDSIRIYGEK